ncbi:4-hydroxy-3-methylbut-2-enyl diphosphatereductase [Striga asiatica]|uniref:4-hydroxy-3-methylbut-2-enyl diphosphatereductase n=1 Tax=Striga asiatica TaxID=4170 RepID=A0A5A7R532_STRAF|nr:4-hydroxy-3-methylbut-2-enyl diphosphatereductase [Striga asiatica]
MGVTSTGLQFGRRTPATGMSSGSAPAMGRGAAASDSPIPNSGASVADIDSLGKVIGDSNKLQELKLTPEEVKAESSKGKGKIIEEEAPRADIAITNAICPAQIQVTESQSLLNKELEIMEVEIAAEYLNQEKSADQKDNTTLPQKRTSISTWKRADIEGRNVRKPTGQDLVVKDKKWKRNIEEVWMQELFEDGGYRWDAQKVTECSKKKTAQLY